MIIRTKAWLIANVAERWKKQYWTPLGGWSEFGTGKESAYQKLIALPEGATEQDVDAAIGNDSWTANRCDECREDIDVVVRLGEPPDYDSRTFYICLDCLRKALELGEAANG